MLPTHEASEKKQKKTRENHQARLENSELHDFLYKMMQKKMIQK